MSDQRLSQYAKDHNISYITAYRKFQAGEIKDAYKNDTGNIFVKSAPNDALSAIAMFPKENTNNSKIPELKYENISLAGELVTRSNKSADSEIVNRFANIDAGIVPYMNSMAGGFNRSGITARDCIILCQKAYFNVAIFRQIIDLIVDLSIGDISFKGGNKKSRDFFTAYLKKIGINGTFQEKWFLELWRSSSILTLSFDKALKMEDVNKITNIYGLESSTAAKDDIVLPVGFTILNPADVQVGNQSMFIAPTYYKVLNGYELERLRNPKNDNDREILESLPEEARKAIKDKKIRTITIELPAKNLLAAFYKKTDYEGLAIPVFFPVLDDINWKLQLKKMDMATTRMMNQAILLVTTGAEPEKGGINPQNITNLQQIFANESVGRVLIADYTTEAQFIIPEISSILDPKKYEVVNNDIYIGLNYILLQGEKFANKQTALQLFIEKIKYGRRLFINEFLNKIIERVSKQLNFKSYPEAYFSRVAIEDTTERNRIIARLAEIGQLTPKETFEALQDGKIPLPDESVTNQEEFKLQKDKGLYQPVMGGPANQLDLAKQTQKGALQLQTQQQEHDAKEGARQRKHEAENPVTPPPSIHINAPTKTVKKPNGRPSGSTRKQSTKRVKPIGASIISGTKIIENTIKYDALEKDVISALLIKHNLKTLTDQQMNVAQELTRMIARNETPENWTHSIQVYLEKPIDTNIERIDKIEELALEHQLEPYLASIVFASLKPDESEERIEIELLDEDEKI